MNHSWMNDRILAWKDQFIWKSFGKTKCSVHELCENEMQKWMNDELSWHCCVVQTKATSLSPMNGGTRGETKKFFRLILREPQRRLNFDNDAGCGKEGRSSLSAKPSDQRETPKLRGFVGRWFDFRREVHQQTKMLLSYPTISAKPDRACVTDCIKELKTTKRKWRD